MDSAQQAYEKRVLKSIAERLNVSDCMPHVVVFRFADRIVKRIDYMSGSLIVLPRVGESVVIQDTNYTVSEVRHLIDTKITLVLLT